MSVTDPAPWREVDPVRRGGGGARPPSRRRVLLTTIAPGAVVAALLLLRGRQGLAAIVLVVATVVGVCSALSPRFRRGVDRVIHAVGSAVGRVLTVVLLGIVEVLVFVPLSLLSLLSRRHRSVPAPAWSDHPQPAEEGLERRQFASELVGAPSRLGRAVVLVPRVVGVVALVVVADLVVGAVWAVARPTTYRASSSAEARINEASRGYPWFDEYRRELDQLDYDFAPFVLDEPHDVSGQYVNIRDGVRRSYEPDALDDDAPTVWFFGGSAVWGEGQRDDHTIPSEIARLAADDGRPIRVVNHAERGDVNYGEVLRLERALAGSADRPDLVVFADGPEDYAVAHGVGAGQPSQFGLAQAQQEVHADHRSWWDRYRDVSLLNRIAGNISGLLSFQPALAEDGSRDDAVVDDVVSVYDRGRDLALLLGQEYDVPVRFVWLPIDAAQDPGSDYSAVARRLDPSVVDVSGTLDHVTAPVYLDGAHTNERGARLVAQAMYRELRSAWGGG